jgi:hypothetical protein
MMRGHRENSKKVLASSGIPSSAKSRDLSVPPGLALHTPVGPELAQQTCPKSLMWGLLLCCRNFIISTASLQHLQQTYFKTFLLFLFYYSLSKQTFFFKKGKDMMRGHIGKIVKKYSPHPAYHRLRNREIYRSRPVST